MKVILLEDVTGAGNAGDVVEVKNGYARNKLLPAGIAIEANKANMKTLEHRRAKIAAKKTADKEMAESLCSQIDGKQVDFSAKAGESGKLFGSITSHDIIDALNEKLSFELDRRKLLLDSSIKVIGMHEVRYRVYPDVEALIKVNITAEGVMESESIVEEVVEEEPADVEEPVVADVEEPVSDEPAIDEEPAADDVIEEETPSVEESGAEDTIAGAEDSFDEESFEAEEEMILAEEVEENSGS
jgi:large subunit ribosomal protein L9